MRKVRGPLLDNLYARLQKCGELACAGKPFTEHRHVPDLRPDPAHPRTKWGQTAGKLREAISCGALVPGWCGIRHRPRCPRRCPPPLAGQPAHLPRAGSVTPGTDVGASAAAVTEPRRENELPADTVGTACGAPLVTARLRVQVSSSRLSSEGGIADGAGILGIGFSGLFTAHRMRFRRDEQELMPAPGWGPAVATAG